MLSCACVLALMLVLGISEARIVAGNTTTIGAVHLAYDCPLYLSNAVHFPFHTLWHNAPHHKANFADACL